MAQQPDPQEEIIETRLQFVLGMGDAGNVLMAALRGTGHQKMEFGYKNSLSKSFWSLHGRGFAFWRILPPNFA